MSTTIDLTSAPLTSDPGPIHSPSPDTGTIPPATFNAVDAVPSAEDVEKAETTRLQKEKDDAEERYKVKLIGERLKETLGIDVTDVQPIGRGNNSIMRMITFLPLAHTRSPSPQPLTSPIPIELTRLIVREANPEGELVPSTAIPNEVIALHFARQSGLPVPRVWDWQVRGEGEGSTGWMVIEVLEGVPLDMYVKGLDVDGEEGQRALGRVFEEEARIVKMVQEIELPPQIGFGGFRFGPPSSSTSSPSPHSTFTIESGPMPLPYGGPHQTLSALYADMINRQLEAADECAILDGWRQDGLRERLDRFVTDGLDDVLAGVKADRPVFVHGDLNMANLLWDSERQVITGVIDFEWSHAAGPADEWFYSFGSELGNYGGPFDDEPASELLAGSVLTGIFPSPLPHLGPRPSDAHDPSAQHFIDWPRALLWDTSLASSGARRPCTTPGFEDAARVYWMAQEIAQWWILQPRMVLRMGVVRMAVKREGCRRNLGRYLEHWGY